MAISDELRKLVDPNNECCCEHCLSNKCKEWAYTNHEAVINIFQKTSYNPYTAKLEGKVFQSDTEPEAIFKATSYVMEQLKEHK